MLSSVRLKKTRPFRIVYVNSYMKTQYQRWEWKFCYWEWSKVIANNIVYNESHYQTYKTKVSCKTSAIHVPEAELFIKTMLLKISKNSQENTFVGVWGLQLY